VLGGNGTRTQTFELAPGILQYVQSVLIEVDTTASPDTTPLLTVQTQDGVPIVDVEQGRSLTAGGAGRASWGLGLDAEGETALSHPIGFYTGAPLGGNPIAAGTTSKAMEWTFGGLGAGVDLLETVFPSSPSHPTPKEAGLYWISGRVNVAPTAPGAIPAGAFWKPFLSVQPADLPPAQFFGQAWDERRFIATGTTNDETTVAILDFFHWTVAIPIYIELLIQKSAGWATNAFGTLQVQRIY
jgi:hypothetical protein